MKNTILFSLLALSLTTPTLYAQGKEADKPKAEKQAKPKASNKKDKDADKKDSEAPKEEEGTPIDENSVIGRMALTVKNYYAAKSPKEKLAYVIDPNRVEPLMKDFYFREALIPGTVVQITTPESFSTQGIAFWRMQVALNDGRQAFVALQMIDGKPKIDWESEVRYSSQNWDEWMDKNDGTVGDFRVYANADSYYPAEYANREKFFCVKLTCSDSPKSLFAYLNLEDPDQKDFAQRLAQGGTAECVLSVKRAKSSKDIPVATVEKVISPSWVVPHTAANTK